MRKYESKLRGAGKIGAGALIALSSATPAFAANWIADWAAMWAPPEGWMGYLLYGSVGLLVVGVALKVFEAYSTSSDTEGAPPLPESANGEPARAYSIGDHRNSILTP
jgi:hypothetical protein